MTTKQQPDPKAKEQDRRAAALRENLRKRKEQARLRETDKETAFVLPLDGGGAKT